MSIVKSFSVGNGDMFYIKHNSDNFSVIDCDLSTTNEHNEQDIIDELHRNEAGINRFISTHPDEDHIRGLKALDDQLKIINFYCIQNEATKTDPSIDFERYCTLRDSTKAFYLYKGCSRRWMNVSDSTRGSAGLSILWPVTNNEDYKKELEKIANAGSPNNSSIIMRYEVQNSGSVLWMGDMETDFMEKITDEVSWKETNIIFAPHHGRKSGKIPKNILDKINPDVIVIGEAPSELLNYYSGYNTLTQNSAGNIIMELVNGKIDFHVSKEGYKLDYLQTDASHSDFGYNYVGSLFLD